MMSWHWLLILADGNTSITEVPSGISVLQMLLAGGIGTAVTWIWKAKKDGRKDAISEWQALNAQKDTRINQLQDQVTELNRTINNLQEKAGRSEVAEARCQGQVAQLQQELNYLTDQMRRIQERMGDLPPGVTPPCEIIADSYGTIKWASASVGSMFHWLPQELLGRNVMVLMPPTMRPVHKRAMEMMIKEKRMPNPMKPIRGYALTKDGKQFAVMINLSGWEGESGKWYINAEIRRRGDSDAFTTPLSLPAVDSSKLEPSVEPVPERPRDQEL